MATSYRKFMEFVERWANHGVPQMLSLVVSLTAISLGLSMMLTPETYTGAFAFREVFRFASPYAWGTIYIVAATAVLVTVFVNVRASQAPLFMLALTYAAQGLWTIPQMLNGGVPQSVFLCIGMANICIVAQLVCGVAARGRNFEKATIHYQS